MFLIRGRWPSEPGRRRLLTGRLKTLGPATYCHHDIAVLTAATLPHCRANVATTARGLTHGSVGRPRRPSPCLAAPRSTGRSVGPRRLGAAAPGPARRVGRSGGSDPNFPRRAARGGSVGRTCRVGTRYVLYRRVGRSLTFSPESTSHRLIQVLPVVLPFYPYQIIPLCTCKT